MIRILLTIVLPLLVPTLLYLLWLAASRRTALAAAPAPWRDMPWVWLAAAGVVLAALLLFFVNLGVGSRGTYVPPKYIDGRVVPGHVVPAEPGR